MSIRPQMLAAMTDGLHGACYGGFDAAEDAEHCLNALLGWIDENAYTPIIALGEARWNLASITVRDFYELLQLEEEER